MGLNPWSQEYKNVDAAAQANKAAGQNQQSAYANALQQTNYGKNPAPASPTTTSPFTSALKNQGTTVSSGLSNLLITQPVKQDAVDKADEIVNQEQSKTSTLSAQLKQLQNEKAAKTQVWENGIYMGENKELAQQYDAQIAEVQRQLEAEQEAEKQKALEERKANAKPIQEDNLPVWAKAMAGSTTYFPGITKEVGESIAPAVVGGAQDAASGFINTAADLLKFYGKSQSMSMTPEEALAARSQGKDLGTALAEKQAGYDPNAFSGMYETADELAAKAAENREKSAEVIGRLPTDVIFTGTQMLGDTAANLVLPGSGLVSMGLRSYGSGSRDARQQGMTEEQQFLSGAKTAGIEILTEKLFGVFGKTYGGGALDDVVENVIGKLASTDKGRTALRFLINMAEEGGEEGLSDFINPIADRILGLDDGQGNIYKNTRPEDVAYDVLVGSIMGGLGSGTNILTGQDAANNAALRAGDGKSQTDSSQTVSTAPQTVQATNANVSAVYQILSSGRVNNTMAETIAADPGLSQAFTAVTGIELSGTTNTKRTTIQQAARDLAYRRGQASSAVQAHAEAETQLAAQERADQQRLSEQQIAYEQQQAQQQAQEQAVRSSGYDSYIRGMALKGMTVADAKEILRNPELKSTWERLSGIKLPESNNRAVDIIRKTQLEIGSLPSVDAPVAAQTAQEAAGNIQTPAIPQNASTAPTAELNQTQQKMPGQELLDYGNSKQRQQTATAQRAGSDLLNYGKDKKDIATSEQSTIPEEVKQYIAADKVVIKHKGKEYTAGDIGEYAEWLTRKYGADTINDLVDYLVSAEGWSKAKVAKLVDAAQTLGYIQVEKKNGTVISTPEYAAYLADEYYKPWLDEASQQQNNTASTTETESTAVDDNPNTHTPEQMASIEEYKNSVDASMVNYIERVRNGEKLSPYNVTPVTNRAAADILRLTGKTTYGNMVVLDKNGIEHIDKRHGGGKGSADATMKNAEDIARAAYVLNNYDEAHLSTERAKGYVDSSGKPAPIVLFTKKIDGTYVVVETVCDTKTKKNFIISTFLSSAGTSKLKIAKPQQSSNAGTTPDLKANVQDAAGGNSADSSIPSTAQNVNTETGPNMRERGNSRNIRTDQNMEAELKQNLENDPLMYQQLSNADTLAKTKEIWSQGFGHAYDTLREAIGKAKAGYKIAPEMAPLSKLVENELVRRGDVQAARQIASDIGAELTYYGQVNQANIILRNSDPITVQDTIQKTLDKLNEEPAVKRGKWKAELTQAEIDLINSTDFTVEGNYEAVVDQISQRLGEEMPATLWEKLVEIRRVNMLLRPRTMVKNLAGNVPTMVIRKAANELSGLIQDGLVKTGLMSKESQTRTGRVTAESRDLARQAYEQHKAALSQEANKYDMNSLLRNYRTYFKSTVGKATYEKARQITYNLLEKGDAPFVRNAFQDSIAQYCSAHGITDISQIPQSAVAKAQQDAYDATFKSASELATYINSAKKKGGAAGVALDVLFPFTTTPINIVNQMIQYSPAGFVRAGLQAYNKAGATSVIDSASRAAVGSVIIGLGYLGRMLGILTGGEDDDDAKAAFDKATGNSPYSILGKVSYDWAQPVGPMLAIGADMYESVKDNTNAVDAVLGALITSSDAVLNQSVFSNLVNTLQSGYSSPAEQVFKGIGQSFVSQMTPGMLSDVTDIVDPVVRSSYTGGNALENALASLKSNVPGLSSSLPASVNVKGEEVNRGNLALRAFNTLLNPSNVNTGTRTEADAELERIYGETGNKNVFMEQAPYKVTIDSIDHELVGVDRAKFQQTMGQAYYGKYVPEAMQSDFFRELPAEQQVEVLQSLQSQAKYDAMAEYAKSKGVEYDSDQEAISGLSDIASYLSSKKALNQSHNERQNFAETDYVIQNFYTLPQDVQDKLLDDSSTTEKLLLAAENGISSEKWYSDYDAGKILGDAAGTDADVVKMIATWQNTSGTQEEKMAAIESQLLPADGGLRNSQVRRLEAYTNYVTDIGGTPNVEQWFDIVAAMRDAGATSYVSKEKAQAAYNALGVGGGTYAGLTWNKARDVYNTFFEDEKYAQQYDTEYGEAHPKEEKQTYVLDAWRGMVSQQTATADTPSKSQAQSVLYPSLMNNPLWQYSQKTK